MLAIERQEIIVNIIKEKHKISILELSQILQVSLNTVRTDVSILEKNGIIIKVHGGIKLPISNANAVSNNIGIRFFKNLNEKRKIAKSVLSKLKFDQNYSIFMDSSTSSLIVAEEFSQVQFKGIIITNFTNIIQILGTHSSLTSILCGGHWWANENCVIGEEAINFIANYYVDIALIGCTAINLELGIFNGNTEVVPLKQKMISNAKETWLLCDSSKFNQYSLLKIADFSQIHKIFTDKKPSNEWVSFCNKNSIDLIFQ